MISCSKVLSDFPIDKLSPVTLGVFSRMIEDAYHHDCQHGLLSLSCRIEIVECVMARFNAFAAMPEGIKGYELWQYRYRKLLAADGNYHG